MRVAVVSTYQPRHCGIAVVRVRTTSSWETYPVWSFLAE